MKSIQDMSPPAAETARGWDAELGLSLQQRGDRTWLVENRHRGPLRVQRPFYPEASGCCHLYLLHPPGGMVLGDLLQINISLGIGAKALATTPSAGKLYDTRGAHELQQQLVSIAVAADACVEWLPQETIVFDGANGRLHTRLVLQGSARACLWDIVCLGRPAANEALVRGGCHQILEVWRDGRPVLIERNRFIGGDPLLQARWGLAGAPVSGTFLATLKPSRDRVDALVEELTQLAPPPDHQWGLTQKDDIFLARYLGRSTRICRGGFETLWRHLRPDLTGAPAVAPRIWNT